MNPSASVKQEKAKNLKELQERKKTGEQAPKKPKTRQPKIALLNPYETKWKTIPSVESKNIIKMLQE